MSLKKKNNSLKNTNIVNLNFDTDFWNDCFSIQKENKNKQISLSNKKKKNSNIFQSISSKVKIFQKIFRNVEVILKKQFKVVVKCMKDGKFQE